MTELPRAGQKLGRFTIDRVLGHGAMGVVYLARDSELGLQVALKFLATPVIEPPVLERFRREVLLARQITHPGICRVFDIHSEAGLVFLSMEYIEGTPLDLLLDEQGALSQAQAVPLMSSACQAVAAAHAQGVVHRDLSPANIIVRAPGRVSILDFGLSKAEYVHAITLKDAPVGALDYVSPEVLRGAPASAQSDVYALGVILYFVLTDRVPREVQKLYWDDPDLLDLPEAPPPSLFNASVEPAMDRVLLRAIEVDAEQRFQSAQALHDAMVAAVGELPRDVESTRPSQTAPGPADHDSGATSLQTRPEVTSLVRTDEREATILFSDIVGITPYFEQHGDTAGMAKLRAHNKLLFPQVQANGGTLVKTIGDAIMATFDGAESGVRAAVAMQHALQIHNRGISDPDDQIHIRVGLHSGAAKFRRRDVFGNTVNLAARICTHAQGDQILISARTRDELSPHLVQTSPLGLTEI